MSSNTKFHKQADKPVLPTHAPELAPEWTDKLSLTDICSFFSILIILLGYPIFICFRADASSPFICATMPSTL